MSAIVCGIDFSAHSEEAFHAAGALAGRLGEDLWLVHVIGLEEGWDDETRQNAFKKMKIRLDAMVPRVTGARSVKTQVMWGSPTGELLGFAKAQRAGLLVVGSAGHANESMMRLGSTSERLATQTHVPLLVVRAGDPIETWARGEAMRVLVGVDETLSSGSAVRWVEKLRQVAPLDVVVGHVYYPDRASAKYGFEQPVSMFTADQRLESLVERDLRQALPTLSGDGEVFYRARLGFGRIGDHLVELAEAERCQLIVLGSHGRTGVTRMWSASAATLHVSRSSVVVVPPDGATGQVTRKPEFRRVLVATDFSECGNSAIRWAYALVAPEGEVTLAHVIVDELGPAATKAGARLNVELAAKLRALPGAAQVNAVTRTELLHSRNPAQAIVEAAARLGADAIVVSSHGRSGFKRAALGSVAEEVLRLASRPVFVVRATE